MKNGFTVVEVLISLAVGFIALAIIVIAMNQFSIIGPRALAKVNQASKAMLIDERLQSQLMKMGPNAKDINLDTNTIWSPYISYDIEVPFSKNYYFSTTLRATITMDGSSIILLFKDKNDSLSPIQTVKIASGVKSLDFQYESGTVKYRLVLYSDSVTSTFISAVTTMNLK